MSLVVAWSDTQITPDAEAILRFVLLRLELDGHTTVFVEAEAFEENDLLIQADGVIVLTGSGEKVGDKALWEKIPSRAPSLLLFTTEVPAPRPRISNDRRRVHVNLDMMDIDINDCGANISGKTEVRLRAAIRTMREWLDVEDFAEPARRLGSTA